MLTPVLPFEIHESPLSYAARLARFHAGTSAVPFLRDMAIDPKALSSSEPSALERLAAISGTPALTLQHNAPVRVGKRVYDLRGELVTAEFLSRPYTVFCPACLREDDQIGMRRGRWTWALSVVRTCPKHDIPLLRQAEDKWDDRLHELERRVPERDEALDALLAGSKERTVSPLQDYVVARLEGRAGPSWLDTQTLDQAVRATELLGVLMEYGPAQKLPELTQDDWDHAGRSGYRYTSRGEGGIIDALDLKFREFDDASGAPGTRKIFGNFYNALAHSKSLKDPGDIQRILREFIFNRIAFPAGEKVLGVELLQRRLHTVGSLAKAEGLNPRTLRSVLIAAEAIPENAASHFAIPVEQGVEIAARVKRTVHVISLPEALNCSRPMVDQLFAERLLTPIYYGRPGTRGRTQKAVDCEEVAMLVGSLHAKAAPVESAEDGMVPVSKAAEKARISAISVIHLILGGFLRRVVRLGCEDGFGALRVDPDEVKACSASVTMDLSPTEAFSTLKIPTGTGWSLVDRHPSEVSLGSRTVVGPDQRHRVLRFRAEDVQAFARIYTTPARLAEQYGLELKEILSQLKRRGVRPVLSRTETGIDFYRTRDLPGDLFV